LYAQGFRDPTYMPSPRIPRLSLPKMEFDDVTSAPLLQALHSGYNVSLAGNNLGGANDVCHFIESGSISIGWDGGVAPCLPCCTRTLIITKRGSTRSSSMFWQHQRQPYGSVAGAGVCAISRAGAQLLRLRPARTGGCEMLETNEDC
jgi:hypothetical protein